MAYDNPGHGNPGGAGGGDENNVFHLTQDMFPSGMAKTLKAGEVIEFRVISPLDGEGDVAMTYNTGDKNKDMERGEGMHEGMESEEGQGEDWEKDLMAHMSPRSEEDNPGSGSGSGY